MVYPYYTNKLLIIIKIKKKKKFTKLKLYLGVININL